MGKGKKGGPGRNGGGGNSVFFTIDVDPRSVRFAHSKIKPVFSGCGRTIEQTLNEIRNKETKPSDLPMITVLIDPSDPVGGETNYFSLNNRRLFVFKVCREEGLLGPDCLIRVRGRVMKTHELERYTVERCSLHAKFLFSPKPSTSSNASVVDDGEECGRVHVPGDADAPSHASFVDMERENLTKGEPNVESIDTEMLKKQECSRKERRRQKAK